MACLFVRIPLVLRIAHVDETGIICLPYVVLVCAWMFETQYLIKAVEGNVAGEAIS